MPIAALLLGGCMWCPPGGMEIVAGRDDGAVSGGDWLDLRAHYGDWNAGPDNCNGSWAVNHIIGGSPEVGMIDPCGRYVAPVVLPEGLEQIFIEAADWDLAGGCADCCPYAMIQLEPVP